jgi:hypothetical protein
MKFEEFANRLNKRSYRRTHTLNYQYRFVWENWVRQGDAR